MHFQCIESAPAHAVWRFENWKSTVFIAARYNAIRNLIKKVQPLLRYMMRVLWCQFLWFRIHTGCRLSFAIRFSTKNCFQAYHIQLTVLLSIWPLLVSISRTLIDVRSMQIAANWCPTKCQRAHKNIRTSPDHLSCNEIARKIGKENTKLIWT